MNSSKLEQSPLVVGRLVVVVGVGTSDIGKGWITASLAANMMPALPLKIDPFLNREFPKDLGVVKGGKMVSDDFATYEALGLPVSPRQNFLMGKELYEFATAAHGRSFLRDGKKVVKKLTFADVSAHLAESMSDVIRSHAEVRTTVVEVGGAVEDREHIWIPDALALLARRLGVQPEIVIVGCLEVSEGRYAVKTQSLRRGIREAKARYPFPIAACFARRRSVPRKFSSAHLGEELRNVAYETGIDPEKIHLVDNVGSVKALSAKIGRIRL